MDQKKIDFTKWDVIRGIYVDRILPNETKNWIYLNVTRIESTENNATPKNQPAQGHDKQGIFNILRLTLDYYSELENKVLRQVK